MLAAMEELGMVEQASTPAPVLVTMFDGGKAAEYQAVARRLRQAGIGTEVFPEAKGIGKQMKYANRKGFRVAIIAGADEFENGTWQVKGLADGSQEQVADGDLHSFVSDLLQ